MLQNSEAGGLQIQTKNTGLRDECATDYEANDKNVREGRSQRLRMHTPRQQEDLYYPAAATKHSFELALDCRLLTLQTGAREDWVWGELEEQCTG